MSPKPAPKASKVTEADPFINLFDDGSFDLGQVYNTEEEARNAIQERWLAGTKTMRVSELPKA
jgi:hypothetical protein